MFHLKVCKIQPNPDIKFQPMWSSQRHMDNGCKGHCSLNGGQYHDHHRMDVVNTPLGCWGSQPRVGVESRILSLPRKLVRSALAYQAVNWKVVMSCISIGEKLCLINSFQWVKKRLLGPIFCSIVSSFSRYQSAFRSFFTVERDGLLEDVQAQSLLIILNLQPALK